MPCQWKNYIDTSGGGGKAWERAEQEVEIEMVMVELEVVRVFLAIVKALAFRLTGNRGQDVAKTVLKQG